MTEWATPFSGYRWGIPEYCNFKGRAIYMDSDMIINADLNQLWTIDLDAKKVMAAKPTPGRYCVMLWDCAAARSHLLPASRLRMLAGSHQRMMNYFSSRSHLVQYFDRQWNNFDGENDPFDKIKILHYTSMNHQFHFKYALPRLEKAGHKHWFDGTIKPHWRQDLQEIFDKTLVEAEANGFLVENYIPKEFVPYVKQTQKNYHQAHEFVRD